MPPNYESQDGPESEVVEKSIEQEAEQAVQQVAADFASGEHRRKFHHEPIGPGILEDARIPEDLDPDSATDVHPPPAPKPVQLSRPDDGPTADQNLWTLIR